MELLKLNVCLYIFRHVRIVLRIGMRILIVLRRRLSNLRLSCWVMPRMKIFLPFILLHMVLSIASDLWWMSYLQFLRFLIILHLLWSVVIVMHLILKLSSFIAILHKLAIISLQAIVFLHSNLYLILNYLLLYLNIINLNYYF